MADVSRNTIKRAANDAKQMSEQFDSIVAELINLEQALSVER